MKHVLKRSIFNLVKGGLNYKPDQFVHDTPQIIWLASYPRSGNTWMRMILNELLHETNSLQDDKDEIKRRKLNREINIPDFSSVGSKCIANAARLNRDNNTIILKTHTPFMPSINRLNNLGFIYIYRNPMDVCVSLINYSFVTKEHKFFKYSEPMTVEKLREQGYLIKYLDEFSAEGGFKYYAKISGTWVENYQYWTGVHNNKYDGLLIRYEDMVNNFASNFDKLLNYLSIDNHLSLSELQHRIKILTWNRGFFWSKKADNYKNYLTDDDICRFYKRFPLDLTAIGY